MTDSRRISFALSILAGLLILAAGIGRLVVAITVFSNAAPIPAWLHGVVDASYVMLTDNGFNAPLSFEITVPIELVAGVLAIISAFAVAAKRYRWGYVVLGCAYASLAGTGGLGLGSILGIVGGSLAVIQTSWGRVPREVEETRSREEVTERRPGLPG